MTELEEKLLEAIDKFKAKIDEKPEYKEELQGWTRTVLIDAGEEKYSFKVDNAEVADFKAGDLEDASITISVEADILLGMLKGEINPMKAYAQKKLKLKAPITDLLKLRKFF